MPAEWEPHEATWIAWPHNRSDWPGKFEAIPWVYAEIVRHLSRSERVNILVNDDAAEAKAREVLVRAAVLPEQAVEPGKQAGNVAFLCIPTNRVWTRDYGPIFVKRKPRRAGWISGRCCDGVAIQCVGQVQRLEARRAGLGRAGGALGDAGVEADRQP